VAFANIDRELAKELLPDGLSLADGAATLHPIVQFAGVQENTGVTDDNGNTYYSYQPYREFILAIPFVMHPFSQQWHNYVVHMYLESDLATLLGKFFAYRKSIGFVRLDPDNIASVRVDKAAGPTVFTGTCPDNFDGFSGTDAEAVTGLANYTEMKDILAMPMLGVNPDPLNPMRAFSRFVWDVSAATITETAWTIKYTSQFDPPDLAGMSIASTPGGAVVLENVKWNLAFPPLRCDDQGNCS
jgi:hypothetical protein